MPSLTLAVTNPQWARIKTAFTISEMDGTVLVPDAAAMRDWIFRQIRARVLQYELGQASTAVETAKRAELEAEGW